MATSFVDKAAISVAAGRGGDGAVAFHREKYIAAGGPDGGDGGRGGDVIAVVNDHMSTLMDFRYKRKYAAGNGMPGQGKRCSGRDGESLTIRVPRGTLIRDRDSGAILHDMSDDEPFVIARGGRGGWGNQHFATPTRQVPRFAKPGLDGERREVVLELKLLADVGLVGFPNVGKSTLLSVVSKAHPKIANYHFTTLFPNLGVVYAGEGVSFVMADIPGIIEGASEGAGLGHDFLRHIDRCRLLVHLVDVSGSEGRDPVEDFETIMTELRGYSPELAGRKMLVAANKCDLLPPDERAPIDRLKAHVEAQGCPFFELSAAAHQGTAQLVRAIAGELSVLPPVLRYEADYVAPEPEPPEAGELQIRRCAEDYWSVEGAWAQRLLARVNLSDYESRMYFDRMLRENGVFDRLEALGVKDGDTISIYDVEFEYQS
ncbi:MAG: GTPase ObgE [Oscillospiraceae bacterium]|nr:GTPase ObgE [Oscillospiraceae bacterium]